MELGLFLNSQAPRETGAAQLVTELVEQVEAANNGGFDLIATGQHYLADYVQLQQIPLLGRLAAEAGDMTIATGINLLPLHHPVEIAEQVTTLDAIATDVVAGVGAGYRDVEFESFGVPKAERGSRLVEGIELMERLWTEDSVSFDGEHYSVDGVSITPRPSEKPPVWVAANAPRAIERAARHGDSWFVNPHSNLKEIKKGKRRYDAVRAETDADTAVPVFREGFVAPTTEQAREIARPYLKAKYERYLEWGQDEAMNDGDDLRMAFDTLAENRFVIGTPAEVCEEIDRYQEELEANHVVFRMRWPGLPQEQVKEAIQLFGDEVVPNV